jgi:hypothetical protein
LIFLKLIVFTFTTHYHGKYYYSVYYTFTCKNFPACKTLFKFELPCKEAAATAVLPAPPPPTWVAVSVPLGSRYIDSDSAPTIMSAPSQSLQAQDGAPVQGRTQDQVQARGQPLVQSSTQSQAVTAEAQAGSWTQPTQVPVQARVQSPAQSVTQPQSQQAEAQREGSVAPATVATAAGMREPLEGAPGNTAPTCDAVSIRAAHSTQVGRCRGGRVAVAVMVVARKSAPVAGSSADGHPYCVAPGLSVTNVCWKVVPCPGTGEVPNVKYECVVFWAQGECKLSLAAWRRVFPRAQVALYPMQPGGGKHFADLETSLALASATTSLSQRQTTSQDTAPTMAPALQLTDPKQKDASQRKECSTRAWKMAETVRLQIENIAKTASSDKAQSQAAADLAAASAEQKALRMIDAVEKVCAADKKLVLPALGPWALQEAQRGDPASAASPTSSAKDQQHVRECLDLWQSRLNDMLSTLWRQETAASDNMYRGDHGAAWIGRPESCLDICGAGVVFFWTHLVPMCTRRLMVWVVVAGGDPCLVDEWVAVWATSLVTTSEIEMAAGSSHAPSAVMIHWHFALRAHVVASGSNTQSLKAPRPAGPSQRKRPNPDKTTSLYSWLDRAVKIVPPLRDSADPTAGCCAVQDQHGPGQRQRLLIAWIVQVTKPVCHCLSAAWKEFLENSGYLHEVLDDSNGEHTVFASTRQVRADPETLLPVSHTRQKPLSRRLAATMFSALPRPPAQVPFFPSLRGHRPRFPGGVTQRPMKDLKQPRHSKTRLVTGKTAFFDASGHSGLLQGTGTDWARRHWPRPPDTSAPWPRPPDTSASPVCASALQQASTERGRLKTTGSFGIRFFPSVKRQPERRHTEKLEFKRGERLVVHEQGRHVEESSVPGPFGIRKLTRKRPCGDTESHGPQRGDRALEEGLQPNTMSLPQVHERNSAAYYMHGKRSRGESVPTNVPERRNSAGKEVRSPSPPDNSLDDPPVEERLTSRNGGRMNRPLSMTQHKGAAYYAKLIRHGMNILAAVDRRVPGQGPGPVTVARAAARTAELSGTHIQTASPGPRSGLLSLSAAWEKLLRPDYDNSGLEGPLPDDNETVQAERLTHSY